MKTADRFADALLLSTALIAAALYLCVALVVESWPQRLIGVAGWLFHGWVFAKVASDGLVTRLRCSCGRYNVVLAFDGTRADDTTTIAAHASDAEYDNVFVPVCGVSGCDGQPGCPCGCRHVR